MFKYKKVLPLMMVTAMVTSLNATTAFAITTSSEVMKDASVYSTAVKNNASAALNLGTETAVSISKNKPYEFGVTWVNGRKELLNGEGELFRYTADGDAYIFASAVNVNDLIISVSEADTGLTIDRSGTADIEIDRVSSTLFTGKVQKLFKLQAGRDYLIRVKAVSYVSANPGDTYNISVGLPSVSRGQVNYASSNSYSIPANTSKTFTFQVSGLPKSTRLAQGGGVSFRPSSAADKVSITSCQLVAPNGKILNATYGEYENNQPVNFENYLSSFSNIPINGTWSVTIKSSKAISGLKFKIAGNTYHIVGKDGN